MEEKQIEFYGDENFCPPNNNDYIEAFFTLTDYGIISGLDGKVHEIKINEKYSEKIEINPGLLYDIVKENGRIFLIKKEYPKTFEECCKLIGFEWKDTDILGYESYMLSDFQKLLICRGAYWKITDWKNDLTNDSLKYCITNVKGEIKHKTTKDENFILSFPTLESAESFDKNFNDLIKKCKRLI